MKETSKDIFNIEEICSSNPIDEYSFTVGKGKNETKVTVKLDISPNEEITKEDMVNGLVQYLNVFDEIVAYQK